MNHETQAHECGHHGKAPMCSCDHNPGGECHCPPNECKCDQTHHLIGEVQTDHACCKTGGPHDHDSHETHEHHEHQVMSGMDHSMHAGMNHSAHTGHSDHSGHEGHDHSHHDPKVFKRQFWWALGLTIPAMLYSHMLQMLLSFTMPVFPGSDYVSAVFGLVLLATGGRVFLKSGWQEIKAKQPGMMALIAMALVVAFAYSTYYTIANALGFVAMGMDFWWELAALITIMLLGHWIEMSSIMKAQNAIGELAKLIPDTAILLAGKTETKVSVSDLKVGDRILVKPGATIPVDGKVISGKSEVNESMITGESRAVAKAAGSQVIGGTINASSSSTIDELSELGALTIEVTAVGPQTMISGIIKLVAEAQQSKSKTQRLADRAAALLFYVSIAAALVTAVVWLVGGKEILWVTERVVTVLVIACPHALGLAIPLVTAITSAVAAKQGILMRSRLAFETLRKADVVLFDKTGTLTTGVRSVASIHLVDKSIEESEVLAIAAGLEQGSDHPIALAVIEHAKSRKVKPADVRDVMTTPGLGVSGRITGTRVFAGGPGLLTRNKIDISVHDLVAADAVNSAGNTAVFVVRDESLLGFIAIGDTVRETAAEAVRQLQQQGKRVAMLSGDAQGVAQSVAKQLGIEEVYAEVLPHQKNEVVARIQAEKKTVVMVGDGVNDAPALALADVGIAIGAGTDVAIESAGIVLVSSDPLAIPEAIALSKQSYSKMVQNLWWAAGYNILAIPLAAGVGESFGLVLTPAVGAVLMSLSTIIVAANAQLLWRRKN